MDGGIKQRDKDKDRNNKSVSTSKNGASSIQKQKQKQLARARARARTIEHRSVYSSVTVIINRYLPTITFNSCQSCDRSLLLSYRYIS